VQRANDTAAGLGARTEPTPSPRRRLDLALRLALCAAALAGLVWGWTVFWFLCDDAFIAFRYVSNSQLGLGYTWNPPPFRPVEGYTSFLWVVLLDGVWRGLGVEPPLSANWLSLLFSIGSLGWIVAGVLRLPLSLGLARWRTALLALVLLGTLTNRTFLAWTSSGLETALFHFLLLGWVFCGLSWPRRGAFAGICLFGGLLPLARPDGLLFWAVTLALCGLRFAHQRRPRDLPAALPLLLPVLHVAWRRATYGEWLPNTYYAKYVAPWPEAGLRYLAAFVLEYAWWIWIGMAGVACLRGLRGVRLDTFADRLRARDGAAAVATLVSAALAAQLGYYTLVVGGDHFEFRVLQYWVPLLLLSFPWLCERAGLSPRHTLAALATLIALGWPLPWLHWWHTRSLTTRQETYELHYRVAPELPAAVRWYGAAWDELEGWLIHHFVGMRHQEHKVLVLERVGRLPSRAIGMRLPTDGFPVLVAQVVGLPGWVLPRVAILDWYGLNDPVIARTPAPALRSEDRLMAHDRVPPAGYIECFRPNLVELPTGAVGPLERGADLTAEEIRECERRFLAQVRREPAPAAGGT